MILGGPGYGKTTFLRFLALSFADKTIFSSTKLKTSKFPIFLSLPDYSKHSDTGIDEYFASLLRKKTDVHADSFVKRVLRKGLAIILLDSLDEVPIELRGTVISRVKELSSTYPDCSIVISCRTADYEQVFENFYEAELAKLTTTAVEKIVRAWFTADKSKAKNLLRQIKNDPGIASLTATPLLLSLICIQFRHDLVLPKRRTELYRRCIDALLRDWDTTRGFRRDTAYSSLSDDRKEQVFQHVAGIFYTENPSFIFPKDDVSNFIGEYVQKFGISPGNGKAILQEIESHHGILEKHSAETYSFSHTSFQEYFAARNILACRKEMEITKKYYSNEYWHPVIEFMVSIMEDPWLVLNFIKEKSEMSTLTNYPPMARRTMQLRLLYRCLNAGAAIDLEKCKQLHAHISKSQFEMARIYNGGGVFPIAVLEPDGVKHTFYYTNRRQTLYEALQPFRKLANEFLLFPSQRYADAVLEDANRISLNQENFLKNIALLLCLVIPLATTKPSEVNHYLTKLERKASEFGYGFLKGIIDESSKNLVQYYQ